MKRTIIYILLIIFFTLLGFIGLKNQPLDLPDKDILDVELFRYNIKTGKYEILKITKEKIEYDGTSLDFNNCNNYTYNLATGILKLDCGKAFRIIGKVNNSVVFKIDNENVFFYPNKEDSYNGEFQRYFQTTKENYTLEGITKINYLKLDYNKLLEILNSNNISYIYIKSNKCTDVCNLYNNIYSSNNTQNNRYYLELDTLSEEELNNLEIINKPLRDLLNIETNYPYILEVQNNNIVRNFEVKVDGFDFTNYITFERNEVTNEETNE